MKPGTYSASPILADGKIYITNEDGLTTVLKAGPQFEILAENNMDDYCLSTIAISEGQLFSADGEGAVCDREAERPLPYGCGSEVGHLADPPSRSTTIRKAETTLGSAGRAARATRPRLCRPSGPRHVSTRSERANRRDLPLVGLSLHHE